MKVLVTGAAGFIGSAVSRYLAQRGDDVVGIDNINDYYDVNLKYGRLNQLESTEFTGSFRFQKMGVEERDVCAELFASEKFDRVVHLAAQAGVRYSIENPNAYVDANLVGFMNILEGCRHNQVEHLVYASSSSVYGANETMPFSEQHNVDHPVSLYAASKKANELMAHTYSHLYGLPTTGLRFFTVYGPWGNTFAEHDGFWQDLQSLAEETRFTRELYLAVSMVGYFYADGAPKELEQLASALYPGKLKARFYEWLFSRLLAPWSELIDAKRDIVFARWMGFLRGHYLKMPLPVLLMHTCHKIYVSAVESFSGVKAKP